MNEETRTELSTSSVSCADSFPSRRSLLERGEVWGRWISVEERLPEAGDACRDDCVLAWHKHIGCYIVRRERIGLNTFFTHWMPLPGSPDATGNSEEDSTSSVSQG